MFHKTCHLIHGPHMCVGTSNPSEYEMWLKTHSASPDDLRELPVVRDSKYILNTYEKLKDLTEFGNRLEEKLNNKPKKKVRMNRKVTEEFIFARPVEAPTFCPTDEEFEDPLAYISKIRPAAEKAGICKIKPPPKWQPPFAVDVDNFKFTPRIQRLNELEAKTRIKLNFLDQIAKFWELQGSSLKIPIIDKKALDLYSLHKLVQAEGGKDKINNDKKWNRIALRLGYSQQKNYGALLRSHYEKILYPYDVFQKEVRQEKESPKKGPTASKDKPPPKCSSSRMGGRQKIQAPEVDKLAKYMCHTCKGGDAEDQMLLCDGCDDSYHTFCLSPPLTEVPKGEWRCPDCVAEEVSKPCEAFGFEQASREYTLQQFGEMADQFKSDYFNMPVHLVPSELVEKEFWRIVSAIDEDVTVEYGADLHTMDHGSGFPTAISKNVQTQDEQYIKAGWNLNNLPILPGSVLGNINADISGMKVPWMYVGMCFATFCWHNEDHWSYSINYLHWGEPKTWYGVPGSRASEFENAMKLAAPELFQSQPDLLHQLVTIMNPNILMKAGVPVFRMDQKAGEFIVTFPRAYHAGFNQGYNFAEAVNFAPADWLSVGRECVAHYSNLHRYCVFSHDELICKMASEPKKLHLIIALSTYKDIKIMLAHEREHRRDALNWGVTKCERVAFELLPDDERLCDFCKTTCFLSAITCSCSTDRLVCIKHYDKLCSCPPVNHCLKYRYTLDEIPEMITRLKESTRVYEDWLEELNRGLESTEKEMDLEKLKKMIRQAHSQSFPRSPLTEMAESVIKETEKVVKVARCLLGVGQPSKHRSGESSQFKFTVEELELFIMEMEKFPVRIPETEDLRKLKDDMVGLRCKALELLNSTKDPSLSELEKCIRQGKEIDMPEVAALERLLLKVKWLEVSNKSEACWTIDYLHKTIEAGEKLMRTPEVSKRLEELRKKATMVVQWEQSVQGILNAEDKQDLAFAQELLCQSDEIAIVPPSLSAFRNLIGKTTEWLDKARALQQEYQSGSETLFFEEFRDLLYAGESLPFQMDQTVFLRSIVEATEMWCESFRKVFMNKNSGASAIEILTPHVDMDEYARKQMRTWSPVAQAMYLLNLTAEDLRSEVKINEAAGKSKMRALANIKKIREKNSSKAESDKGVVFFCVCRSKRGKSHMIRCELCLELFHPTCVTLPKLSSKEEAAFEDDKQSAQVLVVHRILTRQMRYLCCNCVRSRRPRPNSVLALLVAYEKLAVRHIEGDLLNSVTTSINEWIIRARTFLGKPTVKYYLDIINQSGAFCSDDSSSSDGAQDGQFLEPPPPKIKRSSKKDNKRKHENFPGTKNGTPTEPSSEESTTGFSNWKDENKAISSLMSQPLFTKRESVFTFMRDTDSALASDHAWSTSVNTNAFPYCDFLDSIKEKEPEPLVKLPVDILNAAEDLLLEADVYEVSLTETAELWRLVAAHNYRSSDFPDLEEIRKQMEEECEHSGPRPRKKKQVTANKDKRTRRSSGANPKGTNRKKPKNENEESNDTCSAEVCRLPSGKEVTWVQCDAGCNLWFHIACVGLKKSEVSELEQYTCVSCLRRPIKSSPTSITIKQEPSDFMD